MCRQGRLRNIKQSASDPRAGKMPTRKPGPDDQLERMRLGGAPEGVVGIQNLVSLAVGPAPFTAMPGRGRRGVQAGAPNPAPAPAVIPMASVPQKARRQTL